MADNVLKEKKALNAAREFTDFEFCIDPEDPLFVIGVASEKVGIPIWTLRKLDDMGVVCPKRVGVRTRCYSQMQIKTLSYVKYLMDERRVNISGIKVILEMEAVD